MKKTDYLHFLNFRKEQILIDINWLENEIKWLDKQIEKTIKNLNKNEKTQNKKQNPNK